MPEMTPAPRRRPLWRLFIMPALLVVAAAAWSGFWFYAASEVGVRAVTLVRNADRPRYHLLVMTTGPGAGAYRLTLAGRRP